MEIRVGDGFKSAPFGEPAECLTELRLHALPNPAVGLKDKPVIAVAKVVTENGRMGAEP
jgi:hypothetical protein